MKDDEDNQDAGKALQKAQRIEARQFHRVFSAPDGQAILLALKRDFGWDYSSPLPDPSGEVSAARLRAWTGSRAVIATIIHKSTVGKSLSETNNTHDLNE